MTLYPLSALRATFPEGESKLLSLRATRSNLPGGWRSTEYILLTFSVGYFAIAQYDVLFIPYRRHCRHFPRRRKRSLFYLSLRGSETTAVIRLNNGRSICRVLYSKGLPRHFVPRNDNKSIVRWDISLALNITYNPLSAEKMRRGNNLAAVLLKLSGYTPK